MSLTRDLVFSLSDDRVREFRTLWPAAASSLAPPDAGEPLPVVRWLSCVEEGPRDFAGSLVALLRRAAHCLSWRRTYTEAQVDARFLREYGYAEIVAPPPVPHAVPAGPRMRCGFLLLGPFTLYPPHRHEAEEIYVILRGTAEWLQGDAAWRTQPAATVIHHASGEPHAMRTGATPLLAMYLWRGEVDRAARLEPQSKQRAGDI